MKKVSGRADIVSKGGNSVDYGIEGRGHATPTTAEVKMQAHV